MPRLAALPERALRLADQDQTEHDEPQDHHKHHEASAAVPHVCVGVIAIRHVDVVTPSRPLRNYTVSWTSAGSRIP